MTDLSPAAKAVLDAYNQEAKPGPHHQREAIAAALRAAADQPYDVPAWIYGDAYWDFRNGADAKRNRLRAIAAELLQLQALQTLPQGLIPMEYVDADSSARIVSEPSEDGPGGCWVVRNSRHVNPCTKFPTAEAAWDALQRAHALPLPEVNND